MSCTATVACDLGSVCAGYFIYLNWLPTYFNRVLGVNLRSSALLSFLPWLVMAVGCSLAGIVADRLVASGDAPKAPSLGRASANFP